jgi:hypothetical protein
MIFLLNAAKILAIQLFFAMIFFFSAELEGCPW